MNEERSVLQTWGDVIRRYRRWKHFSRRELAQRAGLSAVFLGEIERGEKEASQHSLCLITEGLGVPLAELYMRVAADLWGESPAGTLEQTSLPRIVREAEDEYLGGVPSARDETAFDLYKAARQLPTSQQVSLLLLARSLSHSVES